MPKKRAIRIVVSLLALPAVMGAYCGLAVDFTETFLVTDRVDLIAIDVDDGNVDAVAYDRPGILLKRHTFGYERLLSTPEYSVDDGVVSFEAHCKKEGVCSFDHMFELPLGVGFDIVMKHARIDIGYVDADIAATFDKGFFHGVRLAAPHVELTARSADVELDHATVPESVTIELDEGTVTIEVPIGEYRCELDAGGDVVTEGVTCDDAAAAVLEVTVGKGDITVTGTMP